MPASPEFFVDRSLGRIRVPQALREAGWSLRTLAEVYGIPGDETVTDVEWLEVAGQRGWPVLMKDDRIRYRQAERNALVGSEVTAFCLTSGNLRAEQMAGYFLSNQAAIWKASAQSGPSLYAVSASAIRRIEVA